MHILFYEQAVCKRGTITEKAYLRSMGCKMVITMLALLYNGRVRDDVSTVQRTEAKNGFLNCHVTVHEPPNSFANSLREGIIYCFYGLSSLEQLVVEMPLALNLDFDEVIWNIFSKKVPRCLADLTNMLSGNHIERVIYSDFLYFDGHFLFVLYSFLLSA